MPLAPSEMFAGYTMVRLLGTGGMDKAYVAQHARLPRCETSKHLSMLP